jgi:hypothetical protein
MFIDRIGDIVYHRVTPMPNTTTGGWWDETREITQPQKHKYVVYSPWEVSKNFIRLFLK